MNRSEWEAQKRMKEEAQTEVQQLREGLQELIQKAKELLEATP